MNTKHLLGAAAVAALLAGSALAQTPADPSTVTQAVPPSAAGLTPAQKRSVHDMADENRSAKPDDLALPPAGEAYSAEAYGADVATYGPMPMPRIVTNGPVPDTAENRARYGQPMSRAGKRTAPAGN